MNNKLFIRVISFVCIVTLLYGNCVYALPIEGYKLSNTSPFNDGEFPGLIRNLASKLDTGALPPKEVIRIVDEQLAALRGREEANPTISAFADSFLKIRADAEKKLDERKKVRGFFSDRNQPSQPNTEKYRTPVHIQELKFRGIPILAGLILSLMGANPFFVSGTLAVLTAMTAGPFLMSHPYIEGKIGAAIVTFLVGTALIVAPFLTEYWNLLNIVFSSYLIHLIFNKLMDFLGLEDYKAECDTMYYKDRMKERIQEEWRKRNREPTKEEIEKAKEEIDESTEELKETLNEAEEAILEEIENDGEFSTNMDDETKHNLRKLIIKSAGEYIQGGGNSFDEWLTKLGDKLPSKVFLEDGPDKVKKLLENEKIKQALRKAYDLADKNFLHNPPTGGEAGKLQKAFTALDNLLHMSLHERGIGHDHHHPHGTTLKMIAFFILSVGAIIYSIITHDYNTTTMLASVLGFGAVLGGKGDETKNIMPKPPFIEKITIDLKEYIQNRKIRDYYFSSSVAGQLDNAVQRGKTQQGSGIIKSNALLTGPNSELLESVMESIVSRMTKGEDSSQYPSLAKCEYLIFNPAYLVDSLAIPGTIEQMINKLKEEIEAYYKDKQVVLFINLQDLYDMGQMEGRRGDAAAGIYMRLAPLLESKKITVACLATDYLAKRISQENRMLQYMDVIPLEQTRDYRIGQIIKDEVEWLNTNYKDRLNNLQIKMKLDEQKKLTDRLAKTARVKEPPQVLKDRLELWFKEKFLKKERLEWEKNNHYEQIEKLINEYKNAKEKTELMDQYMRKWLKYHLDELERIDRELKEYETWLKDIKETKNGIYWVTADEVLPQKTEWEDKIPDMKKTLNNQVIDQDPAIESLVKSFSRALVIRDKNHPVGSFIFIGPTGVGKTEVARALSRYLFGTENEIVRIDGSEHGQKADIYKLIGPPPAIIGHEQGGTLTNEVAKRDFCIVLFDELEKAHPEVQDLFLQVLDGARLTDGKGKTVSFQNVILIMTSNLGYKARAQSQIPPQIEELKKYMHDEILKASDDDVNKMLQRLLEDYTRLNEAAKIFDKEIADMTRLLKGEDVQREDGALSFAAFKEKKAGVDAHKKARREYLAEYIDYFLELSYGETFLDISALQYYFACLNYYEDTKPLTEEDNANLEKLLSRIARIDEMDNRIVVFNALVQGKKLEDSWIAKIKEIQEINGKSLEERKKYYLDKFSKEIETSLKREITNAFRQEFINKLGENNIVTFKPLTKGALREILKLKLKEVNNALAKDGFGNIELQDELTEVVLKEGFRPDMGARPLIRALRSIVLEPLAESKLKKELLPGRVINAYLENSKVQFRQEEKKEEAAGNGVHVNELLKLLKDKKEATIDEALKILGVEVKAKVEKSKTEAEVKINWKIQLPDPELGEADLTKIDKRKIAIVEPRLRAELINAKRELGDLETQLRAASTDKQKQIIRFKIDEQKEAIEKAERELEIIEAIMQDNIDLAKEKQEQANQKKTAEQQKMEEELNDCFENLSVSAEGELLTENPAPPDALFSIIEILKSGYRNDPFMVEPSFIVQRGIAEELVRRVYAEKDPSFTKTRFLRLKLTKLTSYLSIIGYFEGRMRDLLEAIHQDDLKKGIKTVVIMDLAEIEKEIERMRVNPFLLSFFLRLFHRYTDTSFLLTTGESSSTSDEVFERYFREVNILLEDPDKLLESLTTSGETWLKDKNESGISQESVLPFEIKQRALRIWRQFYSGEPPLETIKGWFRGAFDTKNKSKSEITQQREDLLQRMTGKINSLWEAMVEEGDTEWTIEKIVGEKDLVELLKELDLLDERERGEKDKEKTIRKDDLDAEIMRQERAKIALKQGEDIDIGSIDINPEQRALDMEDSLKSKIFGQDSAIRKIATAVKVNTAGLKLRNQPTASFLYGGPTGVGKTESAKQTAKALGMRFYRIDLSEYKSREDVWKLIGAPRGYVGWDEGEGTFIDWMRRYPRTVILFDEVEKAQPDIFNILLQVLEDGMLTSNRGRKVDFSESIVFMTTNLGVKEEVILPNGKRETVFDMYPEMEQVYKDGDTAKIDEFNKRMAERVNDRVKQMFRPELLNRMDGIEVFMPFKKEEMLPIAKKLLKVTIANVSEAHGVKIIFDDNDIEEAAKAIVEAGFSPKSGAREMERLSNDWVTEAFQPIYKEVKKLGKESIVRFAWKDSNISFQIEKTEEALKLSEQVTERVSALLSSLQSKKGEQLTARELKELFYPMEAKSGQKGNKFPFTDKAVRDQIIDASPTRKDTKLDLILDKWPLTKTTVDESIILEWVKETIGLSKRINLWRYMWEAKKRTVADFWELGKREIYDLYNEFREHNAELPERAVAPETKTLSFLIDAFLGWIDKEASAPPEPQDKNVSVKRGAAGPLIPNTKGPVFLPADKSEWTNIFDSAVESLKNYGVGQIASDEDTGIRYIPIKTYEQKRWNEWKSGDGGLLLVDPAGKVLNTINFDVPAYSCYVTKKHIFVGTYSGVYVINKTTLEVDESFGDKGVINRINRCHSVVVREIADTDNYEIFISWSWNDDSGCGLKKFTSADSYNKEAVETRLVNPDKISFGETGDLLVSFNNDNLCIVDPANLQVKYACEEGLTVGVSMGRATDIAVEDENGYIYIVGGRRDTINILKRSEEIVTNKRTLESLGIYGEGDKIKKLIRVGGLAHPDPEKLPQGTRISNNKLVITYKASDKLSEWEVCPSTAPYPLYWPVLPEEWQKLAERNRKEGAEDILIAIDPETGETYKQTEDKKGIVRITPSKNLQYLTGKDAVVTKEHIFFISRSIPARKGVFAYNRKTLKLDEKIGRNGIIGENEWSNAITVKTDGENNELFIAVGDTISKYSSKNNYSTPERSVKLKTSYINFNGKGELLAVEDTTLIHRMYVIDTETMAIKYATDGYEFQSFNSPVEDKNGFVYAILNELTRSKNQYIVVFRRSKTIRKDSEEIIRASKALVSDADLAKKVYELVEIGRIIPPAGVKPLYLDIRNGNLTAICGGADEQPRESIWQVGTADIMPTEADIPREETVEPSPSEKGKENLLLAKITELLKLLKDGKLKEDDKVVAILEELGVKVKKGTVIPDKILTAILMLLVIKEDSYTQLALSTLEEEADSTLVNEEWFKDNMEAIKKFQQRPIGPIRGKSKIEIGQEKLGDKKIEILFEKQLSQNGEGVICLGIRLNSSLGRELERLLLGEEYDSEEETRHKLHKYKNLQGFAIACLKLKQAGITVEFSLDNENSTFWIKIPVKPKSETDSNVSSGLRIKSNWLNAIKKILSIKGPVDTQTTKVTSEKKGSETLYTFNLHNVDEAVVGQYFYFQFSESEDGTIRQIKEEYYKENFGKQEPDSGYGIINIGFSFSEEKRQKIVVVIKDSMYEKCKKSKFGVNDVGIFWEVIPESECNRRLATDPEFRELFSWDVKGNYKAQTAQRGLPQDLEKRRLDALQELLVQRIAAIRQENRDPTDEERKDLEEKARQIGITKSEIGLTESETDGEDIITWLLQLAGSKGALAQTPEPNYGIILPKTEIISVKLSHDGRLCAAGGRDNKLRIYDTLTGKLFAGPKTLNGHVRGLDFSPSNRFIIAGNREGAEIFEIKDKDGNYKQGEALKKALEKPIAWVSQLGPSFTVDNVKFSNTDTLFAVSAEWNKAVLYCIDKEGELSPVETLNFSQDTVTCFRFTNDGKYLAVGTRAGYLFLFEIKDGKTMDSPTKIQISDKPLRDVIYSADDRFVVLSIDNKILQICEIKDENNEYKTGDALQKALEEQVFGNGLDIKQRYDGEIVKGGVIFTNDNKFLLIYTDKGRILLYELKNGDDSYKSGEALRDSLNNPSFEALGGISSGKRASVNNFDIAKNGLSMAIVTIFELKRQKEKRSKINIWHRRAGRQISAEQAREPEVNKDISEEIKDIAKRWADALDELIKQIASGDKFTIDKSPSVLQILRKISSENKIPFETFWEALTTCAALENAGQYLLLKDSLKQIIDVFRAVQSFTDPEQLKQIPWRKTKVNRNLNPFLTLGLDGTPVKRKRIAKNAIEIFSKVPEGDLLSKRLAISYKEDEESIIISTPKFAISAGKDGMSMFINRTSETLGVSLGEKVIDGFENYDFETEGDPLINIGISQVGAAKKYVFIVKDSFYDCIKNDPDFIYCCRTPEDKYPWEIIPEAECNYRLTIGEPGFAEMFNWDTTNIEIQTTQKIETGAKIGKKEIAGKLIGVLEKINREKDESLKTDKGRSTPSKSYKVGPRINVIRNICTEESVDFDSLTEILNLFGWETGVGTFDFDRVKPLEEFDISPAIEYFRICSEQGKLNALPPLPKELESVRNAINKLLSTVETQAKEAKIPTAAPALTDTDTLKDIKDIAGRLKNVLQGIDSLRRGAGDPYKKPISIDKSEIIKLCTNNGISYSEIEDILISYCGQQIVGKNNTKLLFDKASAFNASLVTTMGIFICEAIETGENFPRATTKGNKRLKTRFLRLLTMKADGTPMKKDGKQAVKADQEGQERQGQIYTNESQRAKIAEDEDFIGRTIARVAVDPETEIIYAATLDKNTVAIINPDGKLENKYVGKSTDACAVTKEHIFVATSEGIYIYRKDTGELDPTAIIGRGRWFRGVVVRETQNGDEIFVSYERKRIAKYVSGNNYREMVACSANLDDPRGLTFTNDGRILAVYKKHVCIINPNTMKIEFDSGDLGEDLSSVDQAIEADDEHIYVTVFDANMIIVLKRSDEWLDEKNRVKKLVMADELRNSDIVKPSGIGIRGKNLIVACQGEPNKPSYILEFKPQVTPIPQDTTSKTGRAKLTITPVWKNNEHKGIVNDIVFSPDGKYMFTGSSDETIKVWDISNPEKSKLKITLDVTKGGHDFRVTALAISNDGRYLFSGSSGCDIKVWDITNPDLPILKTTIEETNNGHRGTVEVLTVSRNGKYLFSGSEDKTISVWDITDSANPVVKAIIDEENGGHSGAVMAFALSNDGAYLFSGDSDGVIKIWDIINPENPILIATIDGKTAGNNFAITTLAVSNDGGYLFSGGWDLKIKVWDITNPIRPRLVVSLDGESSDKSFDTGVHSQTIAIPANGIYLFVGSEYGVIRAWDIQNPEKPRLIVDLDGKNTIHNTDIEKLVITPDGKYLFSGSAERKGNFTIISSRITEETGSAEQAEQAETSADAFKEIKFIAFRLSSVLRQCSEKAELNANESTWQILLYHPDIADICKENEITRNAIKLFIMENFGFERGEKTLYKNIPAKKDINTFKSKLKMLAEYLEEISNATSLNELPNLPKKLDEFRDEIRRLLISQIKDVKTQAEAMQIILDKIFQRDIGINGGFSLANELFQALWILLTENDLEKTEIARKVIDKLKETPEWLKEILDLAKELQPQDKVQRALEILAGIKEQKAKKKGAKESTGGINEFLDGITDGKIPLPPDTHIKSEATEKLEAVATMKDGKYSATGGDDKIARIYDNQTGELIAETDELGGPILSLTFSDNNEFLAVGTGDADKKVRIYRIKDCDTKKDIQSALKILYAETNPLNSPVSNIVFSNGNEYIAVGISVSNVGDVQVYRIKDCNTEEKMQNALKEPYAIISSLTGGSLSALAFSNDNEYLAVGTSGDDRKLRIYRVKDCKTKKDMNRALKSPFAQYSKFARVLALAFSNNNEYLAVGFDDGTVYICKIKGCKTKKKMEEALGNPFIAMRSPSGAVLSLSFSKNDEYLAFGTGSNGFSINIYKIKDCDTKEKMAEAVKKPYAKTNSLGKDVESISFSKDGSTFAACAGTKFYIWQKTIGGKETTINLGPVYSNDSERRVIAEDDEKIGKSVQGIAVDPDTGYIYAATAIKSSIAVIKPDGEIEIIDVGMQTYDCAVTKKHIFVATSKGVYVFRKDTGEKDVSFGGDGIICKDITSMNGIAVREKDGGYEIFLNGFSNRGASFFKFNSSNNYASSVDRREFKVDALKLAFTNDGKILFTGANGIAMVDPDTMKMEYDSGELKGVLAAGHQAVEDANGFIYVTSFAKRDVVIFKRSEEWFDKEKGIKTLVKVEGEINIDGQGLNYPIGIAIRGNELIVACGCTPTRPSRIWAVKPAVSLNEGKGEQGGVSGADDELLEALKVLLTDTDEEKIKAARAVLEKADLSELSKVEGFSEVLEVVRERVRELTRFEKKIIKKKVSKKAAVKAKKAKKTQKAQKQDEKRKNKRKSKAYFDEMTNDEIGPQIKWVLEKHPERFKFLLIPLKYNDGIGDETPNVGWGTLDVAKYDSMIKEACTEVVKKRSGLQYYKVCVLKGVGFSGHNSANRDGRIYIPIEFLEMLWGEKEGVRDAILEDIIEHEYLHSVGWGEEDILKNSEAKRPGVYEEAKKLFRKYIAGKLAESAGELKGDQAELLKAKLSRILKRVENNQKIELSETKLHRLLWLIDRSKELDLAFDVSELINLFLDPAYTGDIGQAVMAAELEILEYLNLKKAGQKTLKTQIDSAKGLLLKVSETFQGEIVYKGPRVSSVVKNTVVYAHRKIEVPQPAKKKVKGYVLMDEFRAEKYKDVITKISENWQGVEFIYELPKDGSIKPEDVVPLVDPEDINRKELEGAGFKACLPLIYMEKSLVLAAELALSDGDFKDTEAFRFTKGFYENLLGQAIDAGEIESWFKEPWLLNDRIKSLTEELKFIRISILQLDHAA